MNLEQGTETNPGQPPPSATGVILSPRHGLEDRELAEASDEPVSSEELQGVQLALAQARDLQWRTTRQDALQRKLDSACAMESEGKSITRIAFPSMAGSLVAGFVGYNLAGAETQVFGAFFVMLAIVGFLAALLLLPIGLVLWLVGVSRKAALLQHARCFEIEVNARDLPD